MTHARSSTSPSGGVEAEIELEFTEDKPNQLAPLEKEVGDGYLTNIKVLPKITAGNLLHVKVERLMRIKNKMFTTHVSLATLLL